jgi:hypothetical protein
MIYQDERLDVINMAIKQGLVPHPNKWVDEMVAEAGADTFARQFENI